VRALITGATGLIGTPLGAKVGDAVVLSRDPARVTRMRAAHAWDPGAGPPPAAAWEGVDTVFHLAGEPVAEGRWTPEKKRRIRDSRVLGTQHLVAGMATLARPPSVLVCASAVGFYGDRGDEVLEETASAGEGFLADVCKAWEEAARGAERLGVRVVHARIGIVLAPRGGALARMLTPFRMGLGGRLGSGRQWMPWVHIDDVVGLLLHAAREPAVRGPMNVVGPDPVTNAEFTRALGRTLHRPARLPVPAVGLRVLFGEVSGALVASARAVPRVAERTGYRFGYPSLDAALGQAVASTPHAA
jgi:uncharacterized protein (TIGR01777 family)